MAPPSNKLCNYIFNSSINHSGFEVIDWPTLRFPGYGDLHSMGKPSMEVLMGESSILALILVDDFYAMFSDIHVTQKYVTVYIKGSISANPR